MEQTAKGNRLHIGIFGKTNSGKSSLLNAITAQEVSLVSEKAGTTTDAVYKAMEVPKIGPVIFIDTAGFSDTSSLQNERLGITKKIIDRVDLAILLLSTDDPTFKAEKLWYDLLSKREVKIIVAISKCDTKNLRVVQAAAEKVFRQKVLLVSAKEKTNFNVLFDKIKKYTAVQETPLTEHLVQSGDLVLLVMPQDKAAPKGRLILPQVQTIRSLLDAHCLVLCVSDKEFQQALERLKKAPALIIVDSSVFHTVYPLKPAESKLTSFSILFSAQKGDLKTFVTGAKKIQRLDAHAKILIQEACTHAPLSEDVGRVKIPALLRKKVSPDLAITVRAGFDFPDDVDSYDLVIQCGSCMLTRKQVLNRIAMLKEKQIPVTNYGIAIAELLGILDKVLLNF